LKLDMSDNDDNYEAMEGSGKKKYANHADRMKDKYGEAASNHTLKGDPKHEDGMNRKQRRCQDIICLIIYIAFVGAMIFGSVYGFIHGNVNKLLAPLDGAGNFCGVTPGFEKFPYLYLTNLIPSPGVNSIF